jgi:precorrin-2 dehydrogenase / sirohydrochlorin ferrochelatase
LLVDLCLDEKVALIIGKGDEVEIRARQLKSESAKIYVLTDSSTKKTLGSLSKSLVILPDRLDNWKQVLDRERPFLLVISTGSVDLDEKIAEYGRNLAKLVYAVDRPHLNDLNMTGVAKLGDIRVAVSTKGLSPAMAGVLRRKIESVIDPEDILQVKLQGEIRAELKRRFSDPVQRKKLVYKLIRDKKISSLLQTDEYEEAQRHALSLIERSK